MDFLFMFHTGIFWPHKNFEPLLVGISFALLSYGLPRDHGWSNNNERRWWNLDVPCVKCQKHVTYKSGIICANYGDTCGTSQHQQCHGAWWADCFVLYFLNCCDVKVTQDCNGALLAEVENDIRYRKARPVDHLCCAFQCPNYQSHNIRVNALE